MSGTQSNKLKVQCLLDEYKECAECFRHTYATIWQSGVLFATFSAAVFGFFFSFQDKLNVIMPILPFISLSSIIIWCLMVFEPMNHYGDIRATRCGQIEEELSKIVPNLSMNHFRNYDGSKRKFFRVRNGTRLLAITIIVLMLLFGIYFAFASPAQRQTIFV
jgi:hypothetical protein